MHQSTYFEAEVALISPRLSRILKLSCEVASCYWSLLARRSYAINDYIIDSSLVRLSWFRSEYDPNFFSIRIARCSSGFSMRDKLIISLGVANFCKSRISVCFVISCTVVDLHITSYYIYMRKGFNYNSSTANRKVTGKNQWQWLIFLIVIFTSIKNQKNIKRRSKVRVFTKD